MFWLLLVKVENVIQRHNHWSQFVSLPSSFWQKLTFGHPSTVVLGSFLFQFVSLVNSVSLHSDLKNVKRTSNRRSFGVLLALSMVPGCPKGHGTDARVPQTHVSSAGVLPNPSHWCWAPLGTGAIVAGWLFLIRHQWVNKNKTPFWWRECASSGQGLCVVESSNQPACTACTACVFKDRQFFASWPKAEFFLRRFTLETKSHSNGQL